MHRHRNIFSPLATDGVIPALSLSDARSQANAALREVALGNEPADDKRRCCQTNSNQSLFATKGVNLPGTKLTPLGESSGAVELEIAA